MSPPATSIIAIISYLATGPARCRDFWIVVLLESSRSRVMRRSRCPDVARPEFIATTVRVFTDSHQRRFHCRPLTAMPTNIGMAVILITHKPVRTMGC